MTQIPILSGIDLSGFYGQSMLMENIFYVYEHVRKDTGLPFYVGKGKGRRAFIANKHHRSQWWLRVVEKSGGFDVNFIYEGLSEKDAFEKEKEVIKKYRLNSIKLVNLTDGGDGASGHIKSDEWRAFMSKVHKGKIVTQEVREKISNSVKNSGYIPSEEARRKMSDAHKGKKRGLGYHHTEEWKAWAKEYRKGNKSRLGQKRSPEERAKASASLSGRVQKKLTCPHCQKQGGNVMRRYHFDNCKEAGHGSDTNS